MIIIPKYKECMRPYFLNNLKYTFYIAMKEQILALILLIRC